ncbi:MAG TPA: hypothetical protein DE060_03170 [Lentisphaeria bacterium]|nr:hypothetical protein [Lentisphaeria bacterium]HCG48192.1 hypothetical protein [Lentisphaeria bacterium]
MAGKQKKVMNMTVLYILIGVFFVLLTGLNIYAYLTIVGMSRSYAELGFISRNFRFEFKSANDALQEILNGDKEKNLDKDVWNPLKKAEDFIPTLKKLEPSLEDLAKNIEKFKETAQEAYQESDLNIKQQHFSTCERYYETSVQKLDIFESKIKDVIENEMGFVRLIYIILLSSNILVFGAIFYVVYQNNKQHLALSQKVTMENANLNAIMAGLDSVLLTIDNTGIIRNWNANAEKYFDKEEEEVIGKNIYEILPIFNQFKDFFNTVLYSSKRYYKYHERININKGPLRVVNILCVPMLSSAFKAGYSELLVKFDDVTSYRIDDESYIQECQRNSVKDSLNMLSADAAPLFAEVSDSLASLNTLAETEGQADVVPYSSYVQTLASQLALLPQKYVSSLTPPEDNRIHIDLNEMIMYVLRICQKTFVHTINIEVALNESKSWVLADPAQLAQVFLSFMDNASDAMTVMKEKRGDKELGGILSVSIEKITGDKVACDTLIRFRQALNEPAYWVIIISDTGVGIEPDTLPRIFDPFFSTKENPENKGLGLTHAITTINSLGGCVDVSSKPGRGTIFKIYLPETDNAASKSNDATADSSLNSDEKQIPHGQGLILLVDEDSLMRKVTKKLLEKIGYTVLDTDNGFSALNLYAENIQDVACVILDVSVPQMTNADIYLSLKGMNPDVKVIVFPDSDQDESSTRLRENGFTNFIRKPYSLEMLGKMLQRLIVYESAD